MKEAIAVAQSSLSLPADSYIYDVRPGRSILAAICSDDSLRVFDPSTLQPILDQTVCNTHEGVTCLAEYNGSHSAFFTAGRDGMVKAWDQGSGRKVLEVKIDDLAPLLSLAISPIGHTIAAGTEFTHQQAVVQVWDRRAPREPLVRYVECHSDDVTQLSWHPTATSCLLSGSTDELVNLYDVTIQDEDDALVQVMNHGASIHRAGFLSDILVYALSHDEVFSLYHRSTSVENVEPEEVVAFGDLRPKANCEYVVDVLQTEAGPMIAAGSHSQQRLEMIPLTHDPTWDLRAQEAIQLRGAQGEDIVRSIYIDHKSSTVYTGGEDGLVRAWQVQEATPAATIEADQTGPTSRSKKKRDSILKDKHFRPY